MKLSLTDIATCPRDVRFTPQKGHQSEGVECSLCAKSGHRYSMTFSAWVSSDLALLGPAPLYGKCGVVWWRLPHLTAHDIAEIDRELSEMLTEIGSAKEDG